LSLETRPKQRPTAREKGIIIGELSPGETNHLIDVPGVRVGHTTIIEGEGKLTPGKGPIRTGVTMVLPHANNVFKNKVRGASFVMNGFGKTTGLPQLQELGVIETPIAITNTLNIGLVWDAVVEWLLQSNKEIGISTGSVSPIVTECFDGYLNDIQGRHVKQEHVFQALEEAEKRNNHHQGIVGAGTGMRVLGLKSGIGSASREIKIDSKKYRVGVLSVPNFGKLERLMIKGVPIGKEIAKKPPFIKESKDQSEIKEKGSVITIFGTDAPLTHRQLYRVARRAVVGICRTGSNIGHSSGDFIIAFSTANKVKHYLEKTISDQPIIVNERKGLEPIFQATIEATEESIVNALFTAQTLNGRDGQVLYSLPIEETINLLRAYSN
jgi:D-aminopeptidase